MGVVLEAFENFEAVAIGKREVEEHDVESRGRAVRDGLRHCTCNSDVISRGPKENVERVSHQLAVLHDQDSRAHLVAGGLERNFEKEPASFAELAFYPDVAVVELDKLARDRKPQPRSMVRTRRRSVYLRELTKHQLMVFFRDAATSVPNFNQEFLAVASVA